MKNLRKPEEIIINGITLRELLKSHQRWLDNEENGEQLILKNADLRYADFKNVDLAYADLNNANLENANLEGANLTYADLTYANLTYANLRYVNLKNANLTYADLKYANLVCANLEGTNLKNANLRYTDLENANLENANLENTKFYLINLYKVNRKDLFEIGNIGSRNDTTHYFVEDNRVICGCFDNTLEKFINKVKDTYDKDTREYMEYMIAIDTFKRYKEMYTKRKEN